MRWSKTKKRVESLFAPKIRERVEVRSTNYRRAHDQAGRGSIVVDGEEILNCCSLKFLVESKRQVDECLEGSIAPGQDPGLVPGYYRAITESEEQLERRGVLDQSHFEKSLETYLHLSVGDALESANFVHRALVALDRRLGKRRLRLWQPGPDEHPVVLRLLELRKGVEGVAEVLAAPHNNQLQQTGAKAPAAE